MTDDLASYLLERCDAAASEANEVHTFDCRAHTVSITGYEFVLAECDCGEPARVLAEMDAKRRIVELHSPVQGDGTPYRGGVLAYCMSCADWPNADPYEGAPMVDYPCPTLRLLAQPYADRPDFRDSWRS